MDLAPLRRSRSERGPSGKIPLRGGGGGGEGEKD